MATAPQASSFLSIGPVTLAEEEHPSEIAFPLVQVVATHQLPGGGLVVQRMGPQYQPVTWTGALFQDVNDIDARMSALEALLTAGVQQRLAWGKRAFDVLVTAFTPTYRNKIEGGYSITVRIMRDASGPTQKATTASQLNALYGQVGVQTADLVVADPNFATIAQPDLPLGVLGDPQQNVGRSAADILGDVNKAIASVQPYIAALPPSAASLLNKATVLSSSLTLIQKNVGASATPNSVRVDGGNLFHIAAQYYGDASLGLALMRVNGLSSTSIPSSISRILTLPPAASLRG